MTDTTAGAVPASTDVARQSAVLAALTATLATNALAQLLPLNGQTTGEISGRFPLLITPPGYVFGIWGVIYSGLIGYAVYQALPSRRDRRRLRSIAWPFVLSCAANIAWLLLWHYNHYRLTLGAMVGLLLGLITIDRRLGRTGEQYADDLIFARLPFSIYLGWISVATIVNATVVLYDAGWDGMGLTPEVWTTALLGVGAGLGATMGIKEGDAAYPLVLAWAFTGVARKNAATPLVGPAAWAATAVALLGAGAALLRRRA
ncbi:MAG: tryptophan-rich sensory protein [Chloroflexales bacterium]|nr:tryptophan-rich sensory protein [Chloroflexales bacterium]